MFALLFRAGGGAALPGAAFTERGGDGATARICFPVEPAGLPGPAAPKAATAPRATVRSPSIAPGRGTIAVHLTSNTQQPSLLMRLDRGDRGRLPLQDRLYGHQDGRLL